MMSFSDGEVLQNNFQDFSGKVSMIPPLFVAASMDNLNFSGISSGLNRHSKIVVPSSSTANVGNGFMAASRSNIIVGENASLEIASMVWVCAGAKILVPDSKKIHIGAGSIVAPGATASVDVPDNTIVINHNEFRPIRQENSDFPNDWLNTEWRDEMGLQFDRSLGRI
ncbi:MAG: hypothetical protein FGM23_06685 [Alphaproteobacteria bacterium]|nr:hypothetical protein [Alphaproteobacteria bacterium]